VGPFSLINILPKNIKPPTSNSKTLDSSPTFYRLNTLFDRLKTKVSFHFCFFGS
jgi:hypothetical protein